jgi:hypothetical protein
MSVYRTDSEELPLGADNVLDLCLRLRMACNGSADPISIQEMHEALSFLIRRLVHWTPSPPTAKRFDNCVRQLMCAAIDEVEQSRHSWHLAQYRFAGVGVPLESHPDGAQCKSCRCVWHDRDRVGTPCPNVLCPDRRVGAAAGGSR